MMNVLRNLIVGAIGSIFLMSCSDEKMNMGNVTVGFQSSGSTTINSGGRLDATVEITDFKISIREVVFKNEDDNMPEFDSIDVKFVGPYQIDLLSQTEALKQTIGSAEIPNGTYQELRFKLHKDEDLSPLDELYDRSIFLKGTIDGTPFEMWHDTSENMDVGRSTGVVVLNNNVSITVNFQIDQFLNSLHNIDLTQAKDGNGDGLIEINPNDDDGNKEIADLLKENIKMAADLLN